MSNRSYGSVLVDQVLRAVIETGEHGFSFSDLDSRFYGMDKEAGIHAAEYMTKKGWITKKSDRYYNEQRK
jgi:hypothetical protein